MLYVGMREYAVTHATDSSISVVGTDNLINNTAVIVRNSGVFSFWRQFHIPTPDFNQPLGLIVG